MEGLDLNIANYDLVDILKLFSIPDNFTKHDIKQAKKIVMKVHPDKSGLSSEYFEFFFTAYKILLEIFNFRENKNRTVETNYDICKENELSENKVISKFVESDEFLKNFNDFFEKNKLPNEDTDTGYDDWLRSNEDICDTVAKSRQELNNHINTRKTAIRANQLARGSATMEQHFDGLQTSSICGEKPVEYSSNIFSKLAYEDLKKAHTETVVPVTDQDALSRPRYKTVDDLVKNRNGQNITPLSFSQSRDFLNKKEQNMQTRSDNMAYKLHKQCEQTDEINSKLMSKLQFLTN
jgi:hypothetical protein